MKLSRLQPATAVVLALAALSAGADEPLEVDDAWIAEAPPVSRVMAAYMEIENESGEDREATSILCADFERAEFHRTTEKDGIAGMEHLPALRIPANSELELEPGGVHVMLFNPARRFKAGDAATCSLAFDDGTSLTFTVEVRKAAAEDHSHHHH